MFLISLSVMTLFLSEHWMSNAEKIIFENINSRNTHKLFFTPAEKHTAGRPFGGNCFFIRNSIVTEHQVIHEDNNVLAIRLKSPTINLIVIGVYLSCYRDASTKDTYAQQLSNITAVMEMNVDESEFIIMGDFQTFPSNIYDHLPRNNTKRNPLSPVLEAFLIDNDLDLIDVTQGVGPIYTYEHKTLKNQSYIDHIAIQKNNTVNVENCAVHKKCDTNISDHQAVEAALQIECTPNLSSTLTEDFPRYVPKYAWKDPEFQENYNTELNHRLEANKINLDKCTTDTACLIIATQEIMMNSGLAAFKHTYEGKSPPLFSKKWWTPQLTSAKRILATHFNSWRDQGFPKTLKTSTLIDTL